MRIALFGGTFDPPHRGHIAIAQAALERLRLDRVMVAPVGVQPLKRGMAHTGFDDRLAMVRLACEGDARLVASAVDAPRADGRPNYTFDTLSELKRELGPGDELFFIMGADAFETLKHWHRAAELLCLAEFIVAGRPGASVRQICEYLPEGVSCSEQAATEKLTEYALHGECVAGGRLYAMPDLHYYVSATALRSALAGEEGMPTPDIIDPRVAAYARAHGLYGVDHDSGAHT